MPPPPSHLHPPDLTTQDRFVRDARRLYRSDFFPGLGWMTNRATWDSIKANWCAAVCTAAPVRFFS